MNSQFFILDTVYCSDIRLFAGGQVFSAVERRCTGCNRVLSLLERDTVKIGLCHLGKQGFVEYLWNSHSLPIFRSDLIGLWLEAGLTGFLTKPIQITGWYRTGGRPLPALIPTYSMLIPSSHVQLVEPSPEGERCSQCGFLGYGFPKTGNHLANGLQIDLKSWDGSDFFGLIGYPWIFCSYRVLEVTLDLKFKHIAFIPSSQWNSWEPYHTSKWTPLGYHNYIESFLIREKPI
jgi:hypothetical protein